LVRPERHVDIEEFDGETGQGCPRAQRGLEEFVATVKSLLGAAWSINRDLHVGGEKIRKLLDAGQVGQPAITGGKGGRLGKFGQTLANDLLRAGKPDAPTPEA